jgi:hypothetical protein
VEGALGNMLKSEEVSYNISFLKNSVLEENEMNDLYDKTLDTLKILMIKFGMKPIFSKIKAKYDL